MQCADFATIYNELSEVSSDISAAAVPVRRRRSIHSQPICVYFRHAASSFNQLDRLDRVRNHMAPMVDDDADLNSRDARERLLERVAEHAEQSQVFSSADMAGRERVDLVGQLLLAPEHRRLRLLRPTWRG